MLPGILDGIGQGLRRHDLRRPAEMIALPAWAACED